MPPFDLKQPIEVFVKGRWLNGIVVTDLDLAGPARRKLIAWRGDDGEWLAMNPDSFTRIRNRSEAAVAKAS